jgi:hypothetical protein
MNFSKTKTALSLACAALMLTSLAACSIETSSDPAPKKRTIEEKNTPQVDVLKLGSANSSEANNVINRTNVNGSTEVTYLIETPTRGGYLNLSFMFFSSVNCSTERMKETFMVERTIDNKVIDSRQIWSGASAYLSAGQNYRLKVTLSDLGSNCAQIAYGFLAYIN